MIYMLGGNRRATSIALSLTLPISRFRYHYLLSSEHVDISKSEHDAIEAALLDGDGDAAEREMRRHIRHSGEVMINAVQIDVLPIFSSMLSQIIPAL